MFGNLGFPEILIIMVIVLLLFGAKRIPEIAGSMGKGIKEFKKNINEATREINPEAPGYEPRLTGAELEQRRAEKAAEDAARVRHGRQGVARRVSRPAAHQGRPRGTRGDGDEWPGPVSARVGLHRGGEAGNGR